MCCNTCLLRFDWFYKLFAVKWRPAGTSLLKEASLVVVDMHFDIVDIFHSYVVEITKVATGWSPKQGWPWQCEHTVSCKSPTSAPITRYCWPGPAGPLGWATRLHRRTHWLCCFVLGQHTQTQRLWGSTGNLRWLFLEWVHNIWCSNSCVYFVWVEI